MIETQAMKWVKKNKYRLAQDDNFELELPVLFEDGSAIIMHMNGVAVTTLPYFLKHKYEHRFLLDELISRLKRKLGTNKERTSN